MASNIRSPQQNAETKARIFISYSRKDMAFVDRLEAALKGRGFEPLIDRSEIYAFEDWWKRLQALIGGADTVVFVLSPDALASREASKEVEYATSLNKRIAPIVCRRVEDGAVPETLRRLNFIFFNAPAQFEASSNKLAEALQTDIVWIRRHTEYGEAARRWIEGGRASGLLLRPPVLDQSEAWLAFRPSGAPSPAQQTEAFIAASRKAEVAARRRSRMLNAALYTMLVGIILGLVGWINQAAIVDQWRWWTVTRPYAAALVWPHVLAAVQEQALKPGQSFKECAQDCPEMVVVPAGSYTMGSPSTEKHRYPFEGPQHMVLIAKPFAVSKYEMTFADWDACVAGGGCDAYRPKDQGWGRGQQPLINVDWNDAHQYVAWLSRVTGQPYRLLSEAEFEYAKRAGSTTAYPWGDDIKLNGQVMANCNGCGSEWDNWKTAPVGSFPPNKFGLYDMAGNIWELTEDCHHENYEIDTPQGKLKAPADGSAWVTGGDCDQRAMRGGPFISPPDELRSALRNWGAPFTRIHVLGFRVGRTLDVATLTGQQIDQIKQQQQSDWCANEHSAFSSDLQIAGCSALIQSGKLSGEKLTLAYASRAAAYSDKGDYNDDIADLNEFIKRNPKAADGFVNRGIAYFNKGAYDSAIADASEAIKLDPKNANAYNNRGIVYYQRNDYGNAIGDLDRAIALDPQFALAYKNRGDAYRAKGDLDRAIADYTQAITLDPENADYYVARGIAYNDNKRDHDLAIADYTKAIALDDKDKLAYFARGFAYFQKNDYDRALADYNKAIGIDPKYAAAFDNGGDAERAKGEVDHAIADYTQAIKLDPKNAGYYVDRGNTYYAKTDYDHAIADYGEAITLDPQNASGHNGRCVVRAITGRDLQGALADCQEALLLQPGDANIFNSLGLVEYKLGAFDSAIADYSAAIAQNAKDADSLYGRGIARLKLGDAAAGKADLAAAEAIEPDIAKVYAGYGMN